MYAVCPVFVLDGTKCTKRDYCPVLQVLVGTKQGLISSCLPTWLGIKSLMLSDRHWMAQLAQKIFPVGSSVGQSAPIPTICHRVMQCCIMMPFCAIAFLQIVCLK